MDPSSIPPSCRGLHFLLVDDSPLQRAVASQFLRTLRFRVTCVNDGNQALAALQNRDFDVVLMDVEMPVLDGLAATIQIRRRENSLSKHTPIVAFTCTTDQDRCLAVGMDGFASKPLTDADVELILGIVTYIRQQDNSRTV